MLERHSHEHSPCKVGHGLVHSRYPRGGHDPVRTGPHAFKVAVDDFEHPVAQFLILLVIQLPDGPVERASYRAQRADEPDVPLLREVRRRLVDDVGAVVEDLGHPAGSSEVGVDIADPAAAGSYGDCGDVAASGEDGNSLGDTRDAAGPCVDLTHLFGALGESGELRTVQTGEIRVARIDCVYLRVVGMDEIVGDV